jgi:tetratricopeptide (TPR) repeat protein
MAAARTRRGGLQMTAADVPEEMNPAWLEDACLGGHLPEQAELHLRLAGLSYAQDDVAESHLFQAQALAPGHAAVLIALYRFYFYKGRLTDALLVAKRCLGKAARDNQLDEDWRGVQREDAEFSSYDAILPRFYLFTLKAYGYLQMRLGRLEESGTALRKMLELDPSDKLNASLLLEVLSRHGREDEDDE